MNIHHFVFFPTINGRRKPQGTVQVSFDFDDVIDLDCLTDESKALIMPNMTQSILSILFIFKGIIPLSLLLLLLQSTDDQADKGYSQRS